MTVLESLKIWCDDTLSESLIMVLQENNIDAVRHVIETKSAIEPESTTAVVEIIGAVSSLGIAGVLIAWIKQKQSRTISITNDFTKTTVVVSGYSADDVEKIINSLSEIILHDESKA